MSNETSVLIIEDEEVWINILSASLLDVGYTVSGTASTYSSALQLLATAEYDVVLLDINLDRKNSGIELGKIIHDKYKKPFIFITSNVGSDQVKEAIEARPSAYLTKPVHIASLVGTIQIALNNFTNHVVPHTSMVAEEEFPFLFVKNGSKYKKLLWKDIVYLRSDKNYTCIYNATDKVEYFIRSTLPKTLQYILPQRLHREFVQVNRAEAVQLCYVTEINNEEIKTPYRSIQITPGYTKELKKLIPILK